MANPICGVRGTDLPERLCALICGAVQKPNDAAWRVGGQDYEPRSDLVLSACAEAVGCSKTGRMLDYGCGKGPNSKAADRNLEGWVIDRYDLDRRAEEVLSAIPSFGTSITGTWLASEIGKAPDFWID